MLPCRVRVHHVVAFLALGFLSLMLGWSTLAASGLTDVMYGSPEGPASPLRPDVPLPHSPTNVTHLPNASSLATQSSKPNVTQSSKPNATPPILKAIYWGGAPSTYQKASDFEKTYACERPTELQCVLELTTKKPQIGAKEMYAADALVFRAWFTPTSLLRFPSPRRAAQRWVLMVDEAPQMLPRTFSRPIVSLFNLSVSYRRDSDVPMLFGPSLVRTFDPPLPTALKEKGAPVVWVAHNCIGFNNRHRYVEALMKHVNVHSYGDCLRTRDWPEPKYFRVASGGGRAHITKRDKDGVAPLASADLEMLLQRYKFYLAFENQNCEDYVSEKFFRAIYAGLVPIVIGAPNIACFRPAERSILRVADFKTAKDLGDYINYLDRNDTAYEEYLAYKTDPALLLPEYRRLGEWQAIGTHHRGYSRSMTQLMCDVCFLLRSNASVPRVVPPFAHTCEAHNYEADAALDDRLHPLSPTGPLPPALAALQQFRRSGRLAPPPTAPVPAPAPSPTPGTRGPSPAPSPAAVPSWAAPSPPPPPATSPLPLAPPVAVAEQRAGAARPSPPANPGDGPVLMGSAPSPPPAPTPSPVPPAPPAPPSHTAGGAIAGAVAAPTAPTAAATLPGRPRPRPARGGRAADLGRPGNVTFVAVYWGGAPSTYQRSSDFERTYHCQAAPPALPCSLLVTQRERARLPTADAMVCRAWYFPRQVERLPPKPAGQRWVIIIDEAPAMLPRTLAAPIFTHFDLRMSYHLDSEVYMPFGPSLERLMEPPLPVSMKHRDAPVAWICHNCEAFNNRQGYVRVLMRYITVHSYGDCLHNHDFEAATSNGTSARRGGTRRGHNVKGRDGVAPLFSSHAEETVRSYKFYLAFENQNCNDYATEKFYRALYAGAVPVVMGAPNIHLLAPANDSFITVDDFPGPRALADFLRRLDGDDAAYGGYLAWKHRPVAELNPVMLRAAARARIGPEFRGYSRTMEQLFCDLCYRLRENATAPLAPDTSCVRRHWELNK